jgi:cytochrome c oxidase subunit 4
MSKWPVPPLRLVVTWVVLALLGGLSFGLSFIRWGAANTTVSLVIATIMVGIIAYGFIKIEQASPLARVFACVGMFWLLILFGLTATDYAWRPWPGIQSAPSLRIHVPPFWESRTGTER